MDLSYINHLLHNFMCDLYTFMEEQGVAKRWDETNTQLKRIADALESGPQVKITQAPCRHEWEESGVGQETCKNCDWVRRIP